MQVLVIKLGTAVLTDSSGKINEGVIEKLAGEVAQLSKKFYVVLVSSGAVGSGKAFISNYKGTLTQRKAASAIGNPLLIQLYQKYFSAFSIPVAQALCERHHFSNRQQFLQLKETFETFWENRILPIVNENDLVSNVELKFSDNDELATLLAVGFDAETLIICTSAGGLKDDHDQIIPQVEKIDAQVMAYVKKEKSATGLGGMVSKLSFTKLATSLGIRVIMCGLDGEQPLQKALAQKKGTVFHHKASSLKARQKWLASGSITLGSIEVDRGAEEALHHRKSLLAVGIKNVSGNFDAGEVVQLIGSDKSILGVAKVRMSSGGLTESRDLKNSLAAHVDDIVMF
ncbi:MAG: glutamate 5-kinase [Flavisolibacter sp.]